MASGEEKMLPTPKMKYAYLKERFNLNPVVGSQEFEVECEFCRKKINGEGNISRTGNPNTVTLYDGMFHHKDGNAHNNSKDNIQVLCSKCRKHFQYWGMVQRYLKNIGRKQEDLPDCSEVPSVHFQA